MSRDLRRLDKDFRAKVEEGLVILKNEGIVMVCFYTERDVWEQAKLFRQSRSIGEINKAIEMLKKNEAYWLSEVVERVGPCSGRWATNALPGQSSHQFGTAIDCFPLIDGEAIWDSYHPYYKEYAKVFYDLGLECGYYWKNKDAVHVQKSKDKITDIYSWKQIDELMQKRYNL